ncbi:hypothetical protein [Streptomyces sp. NPDC091416]|uniref:hypothetical protein n=1 Tax=Streptomyces sp. NPDC091416 TaxID=3366003 RepID=UPI0037F27A3F
MAEGVKPVMLGPYLAAVFELQRCDPASEVDVEVRVVPFSPQMKLYILNRSLALQGLCLPVAGALLLPPDNEEAGDLRRVRDGSDPLSVPSPLNEAEDGRGVVQQSQDFFDPTWNYLATRLPL